MRKPKIYLDTSVISHLKQDDTPDKMNDTLKLWEDIKQSIYDVYISEITIQEIMNTNEPKRSMMIEFLSDIRYTVIEINNDIREYADKLNEEGILSDKHYDDCLHIGCAVVNECNIILSWNFKHIVRVKTVDGVRYISAMLKYRGIDIYSPNMLID